MSRCPTINAQVAALAHSAAYHLERADSPGALLSLIGSRPMWTALLHWEQGEWAALDCCKALRCNARSAGIAILTLSGWTGEMALTSAFAAGTDAYVTVPVADRRLALHVDKLLKRPSLPSAGRFLIHDDIVLDQENRRVVRAGVTVRLASTDFVLLTALMAQPGRVLSHDQLLDVLRRADRRLSVHSLRSRIFSLRQRLKDAGRRDPIRSVFRMGYVLD